MTTNPIPQKVAYINFTGQIDEKNTKGLMQLYADIVRQEKPDILYTLLSSPGGLIDLGITLFNFLRALPCHIIMHNIGSVESIANVVFLAGESRFATPNSRFLLHGVFWQPPAGVTIIPSQIAEQGTRFRDDEARIKDILLARTSMTAEQIDGYFRFGESKTAEFAKEVGIISQIIEPKIDRGCIFISPVYI
jgi:ATP-dependent protease ClpP protease subunit